MYSTGQNYMNGKHILWQAVLC